MGNDFEDRDPIEWVVEVKNSESHITNLNEEHHHKEQHDAKERDCPERNGHQNFVMCRPMWTDKIKFVFHKNRGAGLI